MPATAAPMLSQVAEAGARSDAGRNRAADLLRRHAAGDAGAFSELVAEHQVAAHLAAYRIVGDGDLANDVVQEAFLRILRHHEAYRADRPFRPWLLHITRNLAIDALRRRRHLERGDRLDESSARVEPSAMEAQELRGHVAEILDLLPEKYRDLLVMRELDGIAPEDIARQSGADHGTTRWRLHHARNLFRQAWIKRFGEAP